jgi:hypothetical protein
LAPPLPEGAERRQAKEVDSIVRADETFFLWSVKGSRKLRLLIISSISASVGWAASTSLRGSLRVRVLMSASNRGDCSVGAGRVRTSVVQSVRQLLLMNSGFRQA